MRLNVSLSAVQRRVATGHNFAKGDRVICKIAKDEWYTGTVVKAGAKVTVDFDDDFDAIIDEDDFKHIKLMVKPKKTKKALTDAEAKALTEEAPQKIKKTVVTKPETPIKKPLVKTPLVKTKPEPKPEPPPPPPRVAPTPPPPVAKPVDDPVLSSTWQIILLPNADKSYWSYAYKDAPRQPKVFSASKFQYLNAIEALREAMKIVPVPVFTLHYVDETEGNAIKRATVTDNVTREKAEELVERYTLIEARKNAPLSAPVRMNHAPERKALWLQVGDEVKFNVAADSTDAAKMRYMEMVWNKANEMLFDSKMRQPTIRFLKEQKTTSFRRRGQWAAHVRELAMSRRVFNAGEEKFLEIFVHEMCHQAVSEIDRVREDIAQGHGPRWINWMVRCGIPPSRYDYTKVDAYMSDEEKAKFEADKAARDLAMQEQKVPLPSTAATGTPAKYYSNEKREWVQCVVAGIVASKLILVNEPTGRRWIEFGNNGTGVLYRLPESEWRSNYAGEVWQEAARKALEGAKANLALKRLKGDRASHDDMNLLRKRFGISR